MSYIIYFIIGFLTAIFKNVYKTRSQINADKMTYGSFYVPFLVVSTILFVVFWPIAWLISLIRAIRSDDFK